MPISRIIGWVREKLLGEADEPLAADAPLIIVITPETPVADELRTVKKLFAAGLTRLHLRRHDWSASKHRAWIESVPKKYRDRIVVHGHADLVREYGLAGVHLQSTKPPRVPRNHRGPKPGAPRLPEGVKLSRSCHDYDELLAGPKHSEYATLGPVFPSISKRGYVPRRTPEEFAAIVEYWTRENKGHPVVALGGITPENIGSLRRMGFAGAAVVGAVWEHADPVAGFRELRAGWTR